MQPAIYKIFSIIELKHIACVYFLDSTKFNSLHQNTHTHKSTCKFYNSIVLNKFVTLGMVSVKYVLKLTEPHVEQKYPGTTEETTSLRSQ